MTNNLDNDFDMKCPECGRSDEIDVAAVVWIRLCNGGTDVTAAENGDHEWDDNSAAYCASCSHTGVACDFEIKDETTNDNEIRAKRAADAVYEYVKAKGEVYEESSSEVVDLITDLLHLVVKLDQGDDPVEGTVRLAQMHFEAELTDGEKTA